MRRRAPGDGRGRRRPGGVCAADRSRRPGLRGGDQGRGGSGHRRQPACWSLRRPRCEEIAERHLGHERALAGRTLREPADRLVREIQPAATAGTVNDFLHRCSPGAESLSFLWTRPGSGGVGRCRRVQIAVRRQPAGQRRRRLKLRKIAAAARTNVRAQLRSEEAGDGDRQGKRRSAPGKPAVSTPPARRTRARRARR